MRVLFLFISVVLCSFRLHGQVITTVAGTGTYGYAGDGGPATAALLGNPNSVTTDYSGNIYFSDHASHCIRKINAAGIISTIAGTGVGGYSGDGGPATLAQLQSPWGIAVDGAGNVYVSDFTSRLRRIAPSGIITTIAGTGIGGYSGDGGPATDAQISGSWDVMADGTGNLYISQSNRVRKIDAAGIITTVAGTGVGGYSGDGGPATSAQLYRPSGSAVDNYGNLYIADRDNNRIRKIDAAGIITTVAGTGVEGYTGDGGSAMAAAIYHPMDLQVDGNGNMYFPNYGSTSTCNIRKVNAAGIISTFAGAGPCGYSGDGGQAVHAQISLTYGIALRGAGDIYVGDAGNYVVRRIHDDTPSFFGGDAGALIACSSVPVAINPWLAVADADTGQSLTWSIVVPPVHGTATTAYTTAATGGTVVPSGLTYTPFAAYTGPDSFTVRVYDEMLSDTVTVHLMVHEYPATPGLTSGPDTVCAGDAIALANAVPGGSWSTSNGNATVSAAGMVTGLVAGSVVISYTIANACASASSLFPVYVADCGVSVPGINMVREAGPLVYPNPNGGTFTVLLHLSGTVQVTNMQGAVIREAALAAGIPLNMHLDVPPGIYFITAKTACGTRNEKIVVLK